MPFHPHSVVDVYAGYGYEPDTGYPHWLLTLSSRGRDYQRIFYIVYRPRPQSQYHAVLFSHETVPLIHLESQQLIGTHDARTMNLFVARVQRLSNLTLGILLARLVKLLQERRPLPREQLAWRPLAPLEVIKETFAGGYERLRHITQRARFRWPLWNPLRQQNQHGAPQQNKLHEMRIIQPEPTSHEQQGHHRCCVIVGPSFALSTLATLVEVHRTIGGCVFVWWFGIPLFRV